MNGKSQPLEIAMDFIKRINAGDISALCELMTEGHVFQDALGKRFIGRETMRQGWTMYFKLVADYQVHADNFFRPICVLRSSEQQAGDTPALTAPARKRAMARQYNPAPTPRLVRTDSGKYRRRGARSYKPGGLQNGAFMRTINRCAS